MTVSRKKRAKVKSFSKSGSSKRELSFSSPLALGLCAAVPAAKDPIDAILWHAGALVIESGMTEPPFSPATYAPLRRVKNIVHRNMEVDGRLVPCAGGFVIELREDRSQERKNFTCAHELGHTFFYEAVPSIKYRSLTAAQPHHDKEEEMLCNIAAAELLMPSHILPKVAKDFSQSPQSLQQIANLFETSLTATVLQLLKLQTWNSTCILWRLKDEGLIAEWIARAGFGLSHYPNLKVLNTSSSSIYHSITTGESVKSMEVLALDERYRTCTVQSMRLKNTKTVLSVIPKHSVEPQSNNSRQTDSPSSLLPFDYSCECDGTRWRIIWKDGHSYAAPCLASQHIKR